MTRRWRQRTDDNVQDELRILRRRRQRLKSRLKRLKDLMRWREPRRARTEFRTIEEAAYDGDIEAAGTGRKHCRTAGTSPHAGLLLRSWNWLLRRSWTWLRRWQWLRLGRLGSSWAQRSPSDRAQKLRRWRTTRRLWDHERALSISIVELLRVTPTPLPATIVPKQSVVDLDVSGASNALKGSNIARISKITFCHVYCTRAGGYNDAD